MKTLRTSLALTLGASLLMAAVFAGLSSLGGQPFGTTFLLCLTYSLTNGLPANFLLPWFVPRLGRLPVLVQWLAIVAVVLVTTAAACLVTVWLFTLAGVFPRAELWGHWYRDLRVAFFISLALGVGATLYELVRGRLVAAIERANQAQLSALAGRMRPHLLFNALNSIAQLIREEPKQAERMVERLAALLRFSLDAEQLTLVPLCAELKTVTDYLELERARYGDRLHFALDVPTDLSTVPVPPLSLQTLVENSVKHAVTAREESVHVQVRAHALQSSVWLEVIDDGPGFSGGELPPGRGLDTLRARLQLIFGAQAELSFTASPQTAGARVQLRVPLPARGAPS